MATTLRSMAAFEGMRSNIPSNSYLLVTQGTGHGNAFHPNGHHQWPVLGVYSSTNSTGNRPMRATGISMLDTVPSTLHPRFRAGGQSAALARGYDDAGERPSMPRHNCLLRRLQYGGHCGLPHHNPGYTVLLLDSSSVSALHQQDGATPAKASDRLSPIRSLIATQDLDNLVEGETNRIAKLANAIVYYTSHRTFWPCRSDVQCAESAADCHFDGRRPGYVLTAASTADSNGLVNAFLVNPNKFDGTPSAVQALAAAIYTPPDPIPRLRSSTAVHWC